jgi:hypothetical protein
MIKTAGLITIKQIRLAVIFSVLAFFSAVFLFVAVNKAEAASYGYVGLSAGFSGAGCPGNPSDWVAVSGHLYDSATHAPIAGTFQVVCKADHKSSAVSAATGCLNLGPGIYFCEGPDAVHPGFSWYATRCRNGWQAAGSGGALCTGGCNLPFRLKASAPGYFDSPTWLVNHGSSSASTLYPEGNANTAHYNIFLDKIPVAKPTNHLNVNSHNPNSGVGIAGSQPGTGGTTFYTVSTQNTIHTVLTAPPTASGGSRQFSHWQEGCAGVGGPGNRQCDTPPIGGGVTHDVHVWYKSNVSTLHVNSTGASGVWISGTQSNTSGHTNYIRQRNGETWTDLTAPQYVDGNKKKFHSWNVGCAFVHGAGNRICRTPHIGGGTAHTVNVHYVDNLGWIQGYKIRSPTLVPPADRCVQNPAPGYPCKDFPPSHQRVWLDNKIIGRANPYSTGWIMYGWHKVHVDAPDGWKVSYRRCVNGANCTGKIAGQAAWVNVPPGGYVDLWWYYHPLNLVVNPLNDFGEKHVGDSVAGVQVTVKNTGVKNTPTFKLQFCENGTAEAYTCPGGWDKTWVISFLGPGQTQTYYPDEFEVPDPGAGNYPTTYRMIARADLDIGVPGRVVEDLEISDNRKFGTYTVIGPPPWFHTRDGGDVGSYQEIEPKTAPTGWGYFNADYLVISENTINKFTSARKWLVQNYTAEIRLKPAPVGDSIYQAMFNKYKPDTSNPKGSLAEIETEGGGVVYVDGTLTVPGGGYVYSGKPAVVFVKEHMEINGNLKIGNNTGVIFIVKEFVRIKKNVRRADGVYLFDGDYDVKARKKKNKDKLLVEGSVIGAFNDGMFRLDRDYRSILSKHKPTEIFDFQPKYLWIFRDFLGDVKTRFDEVSP